MVKTRFLMIVALFVISLGGMPVSDALAEKAGGEVTLTGEVDYAETDGEAEPLLGLWQDQELLCLVNLDAKGKELGKLAGKVVQATGTTTEGDDGISYMTVKSFKIVEE